MFLSLKKPTTPHFIKISLVLPMVVFLSGCVEHNFFIKVQPDNHYNFNYYGRGDLEDIYDIDFPPPQGVEWAVRSDYDKENETSEYFAVRSFSGDESFPVTFYQDNEIYQPSLIRHPFSVKIHEWFFEKIIEFRWIFKGRHISEKYPKMRNILEDGKNIPGWSAEVFSFLFRDCLRRIDIGFNHRAIVTNEVESWLEYSVVHLPDSTLQESYDSLKTEGLIRLKQSLNPTIYPQIDSVFKQLEDESKITLGLVDDTFEINLLLPGEVADTNADSTYADTLSWSFNVNSFADGDYEMYAKSIVVRPRRYQFLFGGILFVLLVLSWKFFK